MTPVVTAPQARVQTQKEADSPIHAKGEGIPRPCLKLTTYPFMQQRPLSLWKYASLAYSSVCICMLSDLRTHKEALIVKEEEP